MENILNIINEYEARKVKVMYFDNAAFNIHKDELEAFKEYGYTVNYFGFAISNGSFIERYSITKY